MKDVLLIAAFAALSGGALQAQTTDLNLTPAQLATRYGKPVKVERAWYGAGTSYSFQPNKYFFIYATTEPTGGRVEDIVYLRFNSDWTTRPYTPAELKSIFKSNLDCHRTWTGERCPGYSSFWDGTYNLKKLGKEGNEGLFIEYTITEDRAVVGNFRKVEGKKDVKGNTLVGAQVRTKAQFLAEQGAIVTAPKVSSNVAPIAKLVSH
jgi:hypothetical protein